MLYAGLTVLYAVIFATPLAALIVLSIALLRKRRRKIEAYLLGIGGQLVEIDFEIGSNATRTVQYIGADGDLRQAKLLLKPQITPEWDRSYVEVLRDQLAEASGLEKLVVADQINKLPGHPAFEKLLISLIEDGNESVEIHEQCDEWRAPCTFASVAQCFEAISIESCIEGLLQLVVKGNDINVRWEIIGERPRRCLKARLA